jgi:glycosyltransferase involved in cell wall biosynthesis
VEVLAASFKQHHPGGRFSVLVIDDLLAPRQDFGRDLYEVVQLRDIGLPLDEIRRMAMIYDVTEFSTAVKPSLLRHLLETGSPEVMYLDPDIEIFTPLDDIFALAREHSIVLTPHTTHAYPRDGLRLDESDIMGAGLYNLGFLALGSDSMDFLDWWAERLRRECIVDPGRMRFTDQRWIDFVPSLYKHYILKDPGCNVAYWNLHGRKVVWTGDHYEVNGEPLRFYHFSGYDPRAPHLISKHMGNRPRSLLSEEPGVARLCAEYARKLEQPGSAPGKKSDYFYNKFENGFRIPGPVRRLYREALLSAEADPKKKFPPVPFVPGGDAAFMDWLNEPVSSAYPYFTRFLQGLHAFRPDLQRAFPDPANRSAADYIDWVLHTGRAEYDIPEELIPAERNDRISTANENKDTSAPETMVDVVGYFQAELGIGEAARQLLNGMTAAGISYNSIPVRNTLSRQDHPFVATERDQSGAKIKILCVNGDATPSVVSELGASFFNGSYTIGVWFWELERFPEGMFAGFNFVDEIWVATEFVAEALRKVSPKPVHAFPLPVSMLQIPRPVSRQEMGIPEGFLFFFSFDFDSVFERKNPIGLVRAFTTAFKDGEGPVLVIKSINGHRHVPNLEKLRYAAAGRSDIRIIDGYLPHDRKDALMALCDCYVSLHRSEGFGLTMAEAMSLAKPVIATQYGGNVDFMTKTNSYLCPYKRSRVGPGSEPYPPTAEWADPDIAQAASLMRHVFTHRAEAEQRGKIAATDIQENQSAAACAHFIKQRLAAIEKIDRVSSPLAKLPRLRTPGKIESKTQHVLDQLETKIEGLAQLEEAIRDIERRLSH